MMSCSTCGIGCTSVDQCMSCCDVVCDEHECSCGAVQPVSNYYMHPDQEYRSLWWEPPVLVIMVSISFFITCYMLS